MADIPMFSEKEFAFLRALAKRKVEYMIVGLSAATLQGAPVVTQDIDLWFENLHDPELQTALKDVKGVYVGPTHSHPPALAGASLELFDIVTHMSGLGTFDQERRYRKFISIGRIRLPVLSLERIIHSKRAANRAKDRLVLPVLEDTATTLAALQKDSDE